MERFPSESGKKSELSHYNRKHRQRAGIHILLKCVLSHLQVHSLRKVILLLMKGWSLMIFENILY